MIYKEIIVRLKNNYDFWQLLVVPEWREVGLNKGNSLVLNGQEYEYIATLRLLDLPY